MLAIGARESEVYNMWAEIRGEERARPEDEREEGEKGSKKMVPPRVRSFSSRGLGSAPGLRSFSSSLTAQWARTAWLASLVLRPAYWATSPNSLDLLAWVYTHKKKKKKAWLRQTQLRIEKRSGFGFPPCIGMKSKATAFCQTLDKENIHTFK